MSHRANPARERATLPKYLLAAFAVLGTAPGNGQSLPPDLPLFADETTLQLTLEAPFRELRRSPSDRAEVDGVVTLTGPNGNPVLLDVKVRVRGRSRLEQCTSPPLRLDFVRSQLDGTVFAGQNRLKLVTLCESGDRYHDYLQLEHDIYKLFNQLTDRSFRVRRVSVEYVWTDARREQRMTEPAFLIEHEREVAARLGMEASEPETLAPDQLDVEHTALLALFQFAIGNTDWSALQGPSGEPCCHNGTVIAAPGAAAIVVPYDFDQAGLINTEYSQPSNRLPIRTVTQRLYRGFCTMNASIEATARFVTERRELLEGVLAASAAGESARERAQAYLAESLDILEDPASRTDEILEKCR